MPENLRSGFQSIPFGRASRWFARAFNLGPVPCGQFQAGSAPRVLRQLAALALSDEEISLILSVVYLTLSSVAAKPWRVSKDAKT